MMMNLRYTLRNAFAAAALGLAVASLSAAPAPAAAAGAATAAQQSYEDPGRRIIVSLQQRRLWLVEGGDTVFSAPVAIGKGTVFRFAGRTYRFTTPTGERVIQAKHEDPSWIPPDWHYYEKAVYRGLEPVHLGDNDVFDLSDGTYIEVRDKRVGRVNRWGNWFPFTPGSEIIFDGMIFIPPLGSPQRVIPDALGPVKLALGDGYLIHGTHIYNQQSIGNAVSHGCIRMHNEDVVYLSSMVKVGTPVTIY
jgi:hypothetical protein